MKTAEDIIDGALEILSDRGRWTKGLYARDAMGREAVPTSDEATCFCVEGALWRSAGQFIGVSNFCATEEERVAWNSVLNAALDDSRESYMFFRKQPHLINDYIGYDAIIELLKCARTHIDATRSGEELPFRKNNE